MIAGLIEEMTGEESGRFSEQERKIAERAVRALDVQSSAAQVGGAVRSAITAYVVHGAKSDYLVGEAYPIDNKKWVVGYVEQLEGLGLKKQDISDVLNQIRSAYQFMDKAKYSKGGQ